MATATPTITYDPAAGNPWSISQQPLKVNPGTTTITWSIQLPAGVAGSIAFDTSNGHPGIDFASGWPGTAPTGNSTNWSVDITDNLQPGNQPQTFHYGVNAIYTPPNSTTGQRKHWDPDIETDPPSLVI